MFEEREGGYESSRRSCDGGFAKTGPCGGRSWKKIVQGRRGELMIQQTSGCPS